MIEFHTGPIMLCEHWYFIQMNNVIHVVKGQRTKWDVCQHPAITFNRSEERGWLNVSDDCVHADSCRCTCSHTILQDSYISKRHYIPIIHKDNVLQLNSLQFLYIWLQQSCDTAANSLQLATWYTTIIPVTTVWERQEQDFYFTVLEYIRDYSRKKFCYFTSIKNIKLIRHKQNNNKKMAKLDKVITSAKFSHQQIFSPVFSKVYLYI